MEERYVFQLAVTEEQKRYAIKLVDFSIANHPVKDIFGILMLPIENIKIVLSPSLIVSIG